MYYYEQFGCGDVAESFDWDKKQVSKNHLMPCNDLLTVFI